MPPPPSEHPQPINTYQEAVQYLQQTIDYEKRTDWQFTRKYFGLDRVERLLSEIGNPQRAFMAVHVAGTKGKGSTAAVIAGCLHQLGHVTGLYTSPHLVAERERIRVEGRPIAEADFCRAVRELQPHLDLHEGVESGRARTYFEILTAMAFEHFRSAAVGWAVVEVGMGGRLDATNVLIPQCCVVTPIGMDHTAQLGNTLEKIAAEKAGIIKRGVPVVIARQDYEQARGVLLNETRERGCTTWEVGREVRILGRAPLTAAAGDADARVGWRFCLQTPHRRYAGLFSPMLGFHHVENCAAAVAAIEMLEHKGEIAVRSDAVDRAIRTCRVPARVELIQRRPPLILDAAHTVESVQALLKAIEVHFPGRKLRTVFGCSQGKDIEGMLRLLAPRCAALIATEAPSPRALGAGEIAKLARRTGIPAVAEATPPWDAVAEALQQAGPEDIACVTGSFYVAGAVRDKWLSIHGGEL